MKIGTGILAKYSYVIFLFTCMVMPGYAQSVPVPVPRPESEAKGKTIPEKQIKRVYQAACPAVLDGRIQAEILPPLSENQCGEKSPLKVIGFGDIKLSTAIILNCRMASSLEAWADSSIQSASAILNTKLVRIDVGTSYQCRRRNNAPDGKISEHGFANALDITGFSFADGSRITVLEDWQSDDKDETQENSKAQYLRAVWKNACNIFTTVLGPQANIYHADHFHFDQGCHGKFCTYRICE